MKVTKKAYNALLKGLSLEAAESRTAAVMASRLIANMKKEGIKPNAESFRLAIEAQGRAKNLDEVSDIQLFF